MSYTNEVLVIDDNEQLGFAIGKASQLAKKFHECMRIYSKDGFFWVTDMWIPDDCEYVAKCWPGGRNELKRKIK